jgi:hypothetical protein
LVAFYETHNPGRVRTVDKVLSMYVGREEEIFTRLNAKYGIVVGDTTTVKTVKAGEAGEAGETGKTGKTGETVKTVKVGETVEAGETGETGETGEKGVAIGGGSGAGKRVGGGKEMQQPQQPQQPQQLQQQSQQKSAVAREQKSGQSEQSERHESLDHRSRLLSFYKKHNPEKTAGDVDVILAKFKGREAEIFVNLARKYPGSKI